MSHSHTCPEISALEGILAELAEQHKDDEKSIAAIESLMVLKDRLNERLVEMEEYFMKRAEVYREINRHEYEELERDVDMYSNRYIEALMWAVELKERIEELESRDGLCGLDTDGRRGAEQG